MRTNLKPNNEYEKIITEYIEANASDVLVEKINSGKKTISDCMTFIKGEAKKGAKSGCAMVKDEIVFGWAIHFFEEDAIKSVDIEKIEDEKEKAFQEYHNEIIGFKTPKPQEKKEKIREIKPKKTESEQLEGQTSLFDFMGM